jgi:hypothetical protein
LPIGLWELSWLSFTAHQLLANILCGPAAAPIRLDATLIQKVRDILMTVGSFGNLRQRVPKRPIVSQAFCSALPAAYSRVPPAHWKPFASLVLEAAYEATMLAAVLNKQRGASNIVLLTLLGGGAFGNADDWIHMAIRRALSVMSGFALDVRLVSYREPSREVLQLMRILADGDGHSKDTKHERRGFIDPFP